ncbi:MAG: 2-hydroxyacyl-CoA dehydratase [Oscillospiraceae bacterium]|jgi:predicted nucleotide-binding protein (sugar kinase/HSP70/actin superfamily)|nr:2-hydroxyacyl-CoA dehydratase [Oscillospiraceae bacterium]
MQNEIKETAPVIFTSEMKKDYTILVPDMATIQFRLLRAVLRNEGFLVEILQNSGKQVVDEGLKHVHNDTCYPALLVIGQMLDALNSGQYDLNKTALLITQTGGGCRASNYIYLLKKALIKAGYDQIPVLPLNFSEILGGGKGVRITVAQYRKGLIGIVYGDLIMLLKNQVIPYEKNKGDTEKTIEKWIDLLTEQINQGKCYSFRAMKKNFDAIVADFAAIPVRTERRVKVGVVGEIYVKYSPLGNNGLEKFLISQGCEVMLPGVLGFMMYAVSNTEVSYRLYGGSRLLRRVMRIVGAYFAKIDRMMIEAVETRSQFVAPSPFYEMKALSEGIIGHGCKMGEGWLLTSEMIELCEKGYENIICAQPFGCLPNHVAGKGMIRKIKEMHPKANIVPIDYDPGASKVNQENRIKLMLAVARESMEE